ncbi:hypothetical protein HGRIS_014788 [Hohenbuehelia grisea]|uniref:Uncharacterized protein n=1 Tax=Hohenbuehelia grisea TaxID=104357 RepID=A0ABR3IQS4_9AGAR
MVEGVEEGMWDCGKPEKLQEASIASHWTAMWKGGRWEKPAMHSNDADTRVGVVTAGKWEALSDSRDMNDHGSRPNRGRHGKAPFPVSDAHGKGWHERSAPADEWV